MFKFFRIHLIQYSVLEFLLIDPWRIRLVFSSSQFIMLGIIILSFVSTMTLAGPVPQDSSILTSQGFNFPGEELDLTATEVDDENPKNPMISDFVSKKDIANVATLAESCTSDISKSNIAGFDITQRDFHPGTCSPTSFKEPIPGSKIAPNPVNNHLREPIVTPKTTSSEKDPCDNHRMLKKHLTCGGPMVGQIFFHPDYVMNCVPGKPSMLTDIVFPSTWSAVESKD